MKILVTGGKGMLGTDLCDSLKDYHELIIKDHEMDVRDTKLVLDTVSQLNPDIIIHLAAQTNVDGCETKIEEAYQINVVGTKNIALACNKLDIPMVYISTAHVFDGLKTGFYNEFDEPAPISIYAKSKYYGELMVTSLLKKYYILRAGWMFGGGKEDKKFVAKIIDIAKTKGEISAVIDELGTPTYTVDLAKQIAYLFENQLYGTYHAGNLGGCTRYDFAKKILEFAGLENVKIIPVKIESFNLPAKRPPNQIMGNYMLDLMNINKMRPWEEALKEYIEGIR